MSVFSRDAAGMYVEIVELGVDDVDVLLDELRELVDLVGRVVKHVGLPND